MKYISSRPIFTLSYLASKNVQFPLNLAFFTTAYSSNSNAVASRRGGEDSRSVRVSVWWDFENCHVPCGVNVFKVAQSITNATRANGIKGPVQINAFGDIVQMSRSNQEALSATGISLFHVPTSGKNSADRSLVIDLMHWVSQNPPPAHIFLISGDRDFATILHRLRMNNYNVLLATTDRAPSVLCSAATIMWHWCSLLKGENLTGKLFNQPPDGPYSSWYGNFRGPLEDPFAVNEQPSQSPAEDLLPEFASESKVRTIPRPVVNHIRQIVNSNPEGISITQLREEIKKCAVTVDKDFYGYQKFSSFLYAMPHVLKLISEKDGQYLVVPGNSKHNYPFPDINLPVSSNGELQVQSRSQPSSSSDVTAKSKEVPVPERKTNSSTGVESIPQTTISPTEILVDLRKEEKQHELSPSVNAKALKVKARGGNLEETPGEGEENESSQASNVKVMNKERGTNVQNVRLEKKSNKSLAEANVQEIEEQDKHVQPQEQQIKVEVPSPVEVKKLSETNDNQEDAVDKPKIGFFDRTRMWWFGPSETDCSDKMISDGDDDIDVRQEKKKKESLVVANVQQTQEQDKHAFLQDQQKKGKMSSVGVKEISEAHNDSEDSEPKPKIGFVKRIRMWWSGDGVTNSCDMNISSKGDDVVDKNNPLSQSGESVPPVMVAPATHHASKSFLEARSEVGKNSVTVDQATDSSKQLRIFSKKAFWDELESFLHKPEGSALISRSTTREDLAQNLQKQGPSCLSLFAKGDLLHLIDTLISDKKWVEEFYSQDPPFRLSRPTRKETSGDTPNSLSNNLFSGRKLSLGEKKHQNPPHTGVPQPVVNKCNSRKTRSEILNDCQKVVNHITENYPEGLQLGAFRNLFTEQQGYDLDLQRLGYDKLVNLLQIMPGMKIESNYILPGGPSNSSAAKQPISSNGEVLNSSGKDSDSDSSWEELGPVDSSGRKKEEIGVGFSGKSTKVKLEQKEPEYEPVAEDDFSDSDEETSSAVKVEHKFPMEEGEGSLMEILNSWGGSRGGNGKTDDSLVNGTADLSDAKNQLPVSKKQKTPGKTFTFVAEHGKKDTMIHGIMSSLKKSSDEKLAA